ncbi:AAA family ATPase [Agrobacterium sp. NPDC090273]|uniref:AAA family ATPase n=1 Tax=Agrobacterium sp. NPDC090273 TaxID=3363919 RepID=UPI00383BA04A
MASSQLVELQAEQDGQAVSDTAVARAITVENRQLAGSGLSDEQQEAVRHVTGPQQIVAVIGFAGAGKSTMLAAARRAFELQGYRVHGAALAGKAAAGLSASSRIAARTLDEAGMIGSKQLTGFVREVQARGAKLVLVGDHEQLQAIGAGSPFRATTERIGATELTDIHRQTADWQRLASRAFATHRTAGGLPLIPNVALSCSQKVGRLHGINWCGIILPI